MAVFKVRGIQKTTREIRKQIRKAIEKSEVLQVISDELIKDIQKGIDPTHGGGLKKLEKSTIARRERLSTVNMTDPKYSPRKSNLTFTGKFLKSIKSKIDFRNFKLTIRPTGKHPGYRLIKGGRTKRVDNIDIAKGQADMGRDILTLSDRRVNRILKLIKDALKANL